MDNTITSQTTGIIMRRYSHCEQLALSAARAFIRCVVELQQTKKTVTDDGIVRIVLTGGGIGIATLREIASLDYAAQQVSHDFPIEKIDWTRVYIFFGDERFLPLGHEERNDYQAYDALLQHITIPTSNIFPYPAPASHQSNNNGIATMPVDMLEEASHTYQEKIDSAAADGFDIHLLGMGPEGHINSLFPHSQALMETEKSVVPVFGCPKPPSERISLSLKAINSSQRVWLLVSGESKKEAAEKVFLGADVYDWPAAGVKGREETILWVDAQASPL